MKLRIFYRQHVHREYTATTTRIQQNGTILDMYERAARRRRNSRFLILCLVIFGIGFSWRSFNAGKHSPVISPVPEVTSTPHNKPLLPFFQHQKKSDELADKINGMINGTWKDYSVFVEDYTSDFSMGISETETFVAASVNKVPILAALYSQAQSGHVDLDRDITLQENEIQDYGTGSIRYDEPGTVYSIKTLARLMIKQSDNTAAYILANEIIGYPTLKNLVSSWGLTQTDMDKNRTSAKDMALLFRKIYDEEIASHSNSQEMLSFLKDTDFETRLPAKLPEEVAVYHKIGTETGIVHDAGIVTDGTHTYFIGIFTNDTATGEETDNLIAEISRTVYTYMRR